MSDNINFAEVMFRTFDEFSPEEVKEVCDSNGALEGFQILADKLTIEKRQEIVDGIKAGLPIKKGSK